MNRLWMITGYVCLSAALAGCSAGRRVEAAAALVETSAEPGKAVIPAESGQLDQIRVEPAQWARVPMGDLTATGKVEANPNRLSHVVLPSVGRISAVFVKVGDSVEQGQPVLSVESPDADQAHSGYLQAKAAVMQAKSVQMKAQADCDRLKDLLEHGAVARKEVLNAQAVLAQAEAATSQAEATVEQSRRRLDMFGLQPGEFGQKVVVRAPTAGKVLELTAVPGEFRNDLAASLMTIADLSSVWISSDVPESEIRQVKLGESLRIELAAFPGESFQGRVSQIADTVDAQTRTIKVRAAFANPGGRLRPEMFGRIQLAEDMQPRPVVPVAAIVSGNDESFVWKEAGRGRFVKTLVTLGARVGDRIAVLSGLTGGDRVAVEGVMLLKAD